MERGGSSNHPTRTHTTQGVVIQEEQWFKRDPDQYMPIANVTRIMRRVLPDHAKISEDAKETIQECVSEFISFVTSKANEKCHTEFRKTVTPDDVLSAMDMFGFDNYVEPLAIYLEKYRAQDPDREPVNNRPPYARRAVHRPNIERPIMLQPQPQPQPRSPSPPPGGYYIPRMTSNTTTYPVDHRGGYVGMGGYVMGDAGPEEFDPFGHYFK